MLGSGMAIVTNSRATPMPSRFAVTTSAVSMTWIRTRRRRWLSETRPSSQEPYAGVSGSRPLCRVTVSSTRPKRCAVLFLADIVASD
ncbi:Uncharacterised protein [Mycobacterium tuberculosis]|uniref:Uncharacterized protein n=2 Tax=Mycobacterium tuberculosis TaxID=1773 RepID=A0A655J853_MYCTX|nr:Uncharacterised protein [Mycobacterium tuberculosis]CKQ14592.1 Uncharacterised protein [Mycobacterium tuberculosis]CKS84932.1 Uncharacterised protein [Mycobacterium tuberculosis]CKS88603.1 Uncharacterised protein [Mycobacterium tuberculosis]CKT26924.1 Uncharacterised protein [Mycobacterium tuberculosis]